MYSILIQLEQQNSVFSSFHGNTLHFLWHILNSYGTLLLEFFVVVVCLMHFPCVRFLESHFTESNVIIDVVDAVGARVFGHHNLHHEAVLVAVVLQHVIVNLGQDSSLIFSIEEPDVLCVDPVL